MRARPQKSRTSRSITGRSALGSTGRYIPIAFLLPFSSALAGPPERERPAPSQGRGVVAPRYHPAWPARTDRTRSPATAELARPMPSAVTGGPVRIYWGGRPLARRPPFGRQLGEDVRRIETAGLPLSPARWGPRRPPTRSRPRLWPMIVASAEDDGPKSRWGFRGRAWRSDLRRQERSSQLASGQGRSEEHTSELQSRGHRVCRLLLEKKNAKDSGPVTRRWKRTHPTS